MFNPNNDSCKKCIAAISYYRARIGEDELKRICKNICGKSRQEVKPIEPDLFTGIKKLEHNPMPKLDKFSHAQVNFTPKKTSF